MHLARSVALGAAALMSVAAAGCNGCSVCAVPVYSGNALLPAVVDLHVALVGDDTSGTPHGISMIKLEDNMGTALASPILSFLPIAGAADLDAQDLTPDGTHGASVDGRTIYFFTGANTGSLQLSPSSLKVTTFGTDGDAISTLPDGNEAVVSADGANLVVVSQILGGNPQLADTIALPAKRDGMAISNDGRTLLARGPTGLTVFAIKQTAPHTGSLGVSVSHTYTLVADIPAEGRHVGVEDGRLGMGFSPIDFSRAVVVGTPANAKSASVVTGLPNAPAIGAGLIASGVSTLFCVAVGRDGNTAFAGADTGIVVLSGVSSGALAQIGSVVSPKFTVGSKTYALTNVYTLGITLDGKYIAAFTPQPSIKSGTMLLLQIGSGGTLTLVSQLTGIPIPRNDQVLMH